MRPEVVKEDGRVWSGPTVEHLIFCLSRTDISFAGGGGCSLKSCGSYYLWSASAERHMAQAESVAVLHSSWHTDLSLDKHKVPASSISVFLSMFFKLELEKDIPFPFGQKAARMYIQGSYVFYSHRGTGLRAWRQRQEMSREPWWPGSSWHILSRLNCSASNLWANPVFSHKSPR